MSEGKESRGHFTQVVQSERRSVLLLSMIALLAVIVDIALQSSVPRTSPLDLLLQVGMAIGFIGVLVWQMLDAASYARHALLAITLIAAIGEVLRLHLALFGEAWGVLPDPALPTSLNYLPVLTLALFAFNPRQDAARLGGILLLVTALPFIVYLLFHLDYLPRSPRLVDIMHSLLLINPLTLMLCVLFAKIHVQAAHRQTARHRVPDAGANETDHRTMSFNRQGMQRVIQEAVDTARSSGRELSFGLLELSDSEQTGAAQIEDQLRSIIQSFTAHLSSEHLLVGRWSKQRLLLLFPGQTIAPVSAECEQVLEEINRKQRLVDLGLVLYQPGETIMSLLKRADDQLQEAKKATGLGLAFQADEAF